MKAIVLLTLALQLSFVPVRLSAQQGGAIGGCGISQGSSTSSQVLDRCPKDVKYAFSVHTGAAVPLGSLRSNAGTGFTTNLDMVFPVNAKWSWDLRLGYSWFPQPQGSANRIRMVDVSGNAAFALLPRRKWWLFLNGGPGLYYIDPGTFHPGVNGGVGLGRAMSSSAVFEVTCNIHSTLTAPRASFVKSQVGIVTTQAGVIRGSRAVWNAAVDMLGWLTHRQGGSP